MAYINGKKVLQFVKTVDTQPTQTYYKHSVKMQGTYNSTQYTVYAEFISTDGTNWATEGFSWDDALDAYEGIVAGKSNFGSRFQYLECTGSLGQYQSELYYDIENRTTGNGNNETVDMAVFNFVTDTVTPIN